LQGWAMSSALVGCLVGAVISGMLSDRFGRKRLLILAALLFTLSAIGTALAMGFATFNLFRWIGGVGIGLASNLSPMYIAEVSPAEVRGRLVSINQLTIVIGILAAQLTNWLIAEPVPTADQICLLLDPSPAGAAAAEYGGFDIAAETDAARQMADPAALAAVREAFPDARFFATVPDQRQQAKQEQDARLVTTYLGETWNGRYGWRWMFAAETIPATLFFLLMFFVPESPRWLIKAGRDEPAARVLARVGGAAYAAAEVADIKATLSREEIARVRLSDLLEPKLMRLLGLGVFLAVFQQWCGINVIFNYAQEVFAEAGYTVSDIMLNIVVTGVVNLAFTFVAIYTVDRFGRRPLMLLGAGGLALIYAALGAGYFLQSTGVHMLFLVILAIACYAMSLAPVTWVVISEIFPNRIRGAAVSVAVSALWIGCTALTFSFPFLKRSLGAHGTFWLYGAICVVGLVVIFLRLPETKGKSLEDIERQLNDLA
jgi:MFS family permease